MKAQLDVIGMVVEDMGRSLAFYRLLGLEVPPEADGQPHVEAVMPGGLRLAWDTVETIQSFYPDWRPGNGQGMSLAFRFDTPAEVDEAYEQLILLGYEGDKEPWDAFWGQRYAVIHDPDGNGVDLFAPNAES
ncbi:VOC family protein [Streptosporangium amethystogenes subsp. fukuiense]|uniref:VOC family protein n=1 Tax=Streptosporangium amethystogenes subsp. fukuiense TaxID=698418 RepID=A0ABW2TAI1_9ACTN